MINLILVILLVLATGKSVASRNALKIQETFNEIVKTAQTPVSSNVDQCDKDTDKTIMNFLGNSLGKYDRWLAMDDPSGPDPTEITLSTTELKGKLGNRLDAILKISNQRMVDHSRSGPNLMFPFSEKSQNILGVARAVLDGPDVIFTGDYTATGFFKVSPSVSLPFSGKGWYTFYGNDMAETIMYKGYTVNQNGNIDISTSVSTKYVCLITWNDVEFKGLQFDNGKEIDLIWMSKLQRQLADLYAVFLEDSLTFKEFTNHVPPKRLLNEYLEESLTSVKLIDTSLRVQPTTIIPVADKASCMHLNNSVLMVLIMVIYLLCPN